MASAIRHREALVEGATIHVAEAGAPGAPAFLCLHGWPESWAAFEPLMACLQDEARVVAIDLPGVGGSTTPAASGRKSDIAAMLHALVQQERLGNAVLVGHDVGAMVAYAFLRRYPGAMARVVLMDSAIPGISPWEEVVANPAIWHFAFHAVPGLPEALVAGREARYFEYFQRALSARADAAAPRAALHARAYVRPSALSAGFGWYRAFEQDAADNRESAGREIDTPVLYLRGSEERGIALERYVDGLRGSRLIRVRGAIVPGSGHFAPEEAPEALARLLLHA